MVYTMYAVQDTMVGFGVPLMMINENVAKRDYANFLKSPQCKNPTDMRLYKIGTYNDETGELTGELPVQILGGGDDEGCI